MTLDEAIVHAQEVADKGCEQCARDHQQLADWLKELKKLREVGWHPASELPELNEYGNSEPVYVYALYGTNNSRLLPMISFVIEGKWHDNNIKYWCYPPKED